jgi:hypothetical protein
MYCGEEIEFRYVDGQRTPIHLAGGWCSGHNDSSPHRSSKPFGTVTSYVNPNAHCPVCGKKVFFYQSPFGGRVFFDDLGWPWPKHPCTDNPRSQTETVKNLKGTAHRSFLSKAGESLTLYELVNATERTDSIFLEFRQLAQHLRVFRVAVPKELLTRCDITMKDLRKAPAFVIRFYDDHRLIEFISGRKRMIEALRRGLHTCVTH